MKQYKLTEKSFYFLMIMLILIDRIIQLTNYNFKYTGNDDVVFWQGALHYSNGFFHEPYMFGQNYNFMLESFLAVPFILIGMPYQIAFPIVTSLMILLPFFVFSFVLFKQKKFIASYIFILTPLFMPVEFGILTSVSRGFVTGIFFLTPIILTVIHPNRISSFIIYGFSAGLAFIFNPNSLYVSFPIGVFLLFLNYKNILFYIVTFIPLFSCYLIEYYSKQFYVNNSKFLVHEMWKLEWTFDNFIYSFSHLDKLFWGLTPLVWIIPWLILIGILSIAIFLFKRNKIYSISLFSGIFLVLYTFGLNKVHDNIDSIFLSSSRMFLSLPLLLGLAIYWFVEEGRMKIGTEKLNTYFVFIILFSLFKINVSNPIIFKHIYKRDFGPVAVIEIKELKKRCEEIYTVAKEENVDLIFYASSYEFKVTEMEFYNYGCNCLLDENIPSILNKYERRFWVYDEFYAAKIKRIMYYGEIYPEQLKNYTGKIKTVNNKIHIIENEEFTLIEIITKLNGILIRY